MEILCNLTGSVKIQDGGHKISIACISASRQGNQQDVTDIPTAKPTLLRSSIPLGLMGELCDGTGSGKIQDGGRQTSNACIFAPRQDINEIPTAIPMFLESSIPTRLVEILCNQIGSWHSKMAASKLQMHVSAIPDKISAKFHWLYLYFRGLAFHLNSREY